ncbi:MAG: alpha/beta fold hydrolase [Gammaproteobacteria bacterium]
MLALLSKEETEVTINGPAGELEVIIAEPIGKDRKALGFVCHPHPLYGGTMTNKVVTTLVKTFQHQGLTTVRFNFRGVGKSEGVFDRGLGELNDLFAVIKWVQKEYPTQEIWLAGFSFGAFIATKAATMLTTKALVTVAPPVERFPMSDLSPVVDKWVLVQGEKDDVVSAPEVLAWAESRKPRPTIIRFPEAGHFFHGQLGELRAKIEDALG